MNNNEHRNDEGFYALLHQRIQAYFTKRMDAHLQYNELLEIVKKTAEEFGYQYKDLNIFGAFDQYLKPKQKPAKVSPHPQMRAFERKKVV